MSVLKAVLYAHEGEIFVVSQCCEDVLKKKDTKEDWPSISLSKMEQNPNQEIPKGVGVCDWCDKENEVPGFKVKYLP